MMNVTPTQVFAWAATLTAQQDYQTLTHEFLEILSSIQGVQKAVAYEIYDRRKKKTGEAGNACEQLVRRFPLDFTRDESNDHNDLLKVLANNADVVPKKSDANGQYRQVFLTIKNTQGPNRTIALDGLFNRETVTLLHDLLAIYRNQVILHDSKERDVLTKLPNRQSFDARLLQVCEHYLNNPISDKVQEKSSWIAFLDIDHFKRVNDDFGHLYGDEVLLVFSQLMEKHFRYNDFLFRFGGEEFVVILNLTDLAGAEKTFNRFRETVATHQFPTVGKVTVSIGVTHIDSMCMPTTLLDRADKALYYAKDTGRNQVVVYENTSELFQDTDASDIELF
ncbi:MAG: hypothetical protein Kow0065_09980 [Methylomicrobium sp.]